MDWTVYLLSICDNVAEVRFAAMVLFVPSVVIWGFARAMAAEEDDGKDKDKMVRTTTRFAKLWVAALVVAALSALIPTQKTIMRAYFMTQGAKVVNAPNAEKAITEFTKRVDRIIKVIEKE